MGGSNPMALETDSLSDFFVAEEIVVEEEFNAPQVLIQKKYDGLFTVVEWDKGEVKIFSDSGLWIEDQFPSLVSWMEKKQWPAEQFILCAECDAWVKGRHQPRELIAAKVHEKKPVPAGEFCFNVFTCLYFDGDIHKKTERERLKVLDRFDFGQSTIGVPNTSIPMNKAPSFLPKSTSELKSMLNKCCRAPGSEGAMIKLLDTESSSYSLRGSTTAVIKLKNYAEVHCVVLKINKTKVSEKTWNYEIGLRFTSQDHVTDQDKFRIGPKEYHHCGRTYNTSIKAAVGDILTISFHSINLYIDPETEEKRLHLYEPRVKEKWIEAKEPDFFSAAVQIGEDSGLLVTKREAKSLDLLYSVPAGKVKHFLPEYRRGEDYDRGILELEKIPEGIAPRRFIWFAISGEEDEQNSVSGTD
jgi:hypothetical protein